MSPQSQGIEYGHREVATQPQSVYVHMAKHLQQRADELAKIAGSIFNVHANGYHEHSRGEIITRAAMESDVARRIAMVEYLYPPVSARALAIQTLSETALQIIEGRSTFNSTQMQSVHNPVAAGFSMLNMLEVISEVPFDESQALNSARILTCGVLDEYKSAGGAIIDITAPITIANRKFLHYLYRQDPSEFANFAHAGGLPYIQALMIPQLIPQLIPQS